MDAAMFGPKDIIRLTRETWGTPRGSEGEVIGWYTNDPTTVLVRLWDGGVQRVPREAIELVQAAEKQRDPF
jgi:hypothetical protein